MLMEFLKLIIWLQAHNKSDENILLTVFSLLVNYFSNTRVIYNYEMSNHDSPEQGICNETCKVESN